MEKCNTKMIARSVNGSVFKCHSCNKIHIEFKNLHFSFNEDEFDIFRQYFLSLEPEKWEYINKNSIYQRKILVPIGHKNLKLMFNANEVYELQDIFQKTQNSKSHFELIKTDFIASEMSLN